MLELLRSSTVSGQAQEQYCTSSSQVPAPLLQLFQLVQKGQMTVNVSSQPAPQAGALLRLQGLEAGGQNQRASLGAAQCCFGEKQEEGRATGPSCCWIQKKGGIIMGRKLCWLLKQGPVTHRFCLGRPHSGSVAPGAVPDCSGLNTWAETSFLLPLHGAAEGSRGNKSH